MQKQNPNLINHVVFVIDRSYSMACRQAETIRVFDNEIHNLASDSQHFNQETRVSVFLFGSEIECVIYDMDVLRLPSLAELYEIEGNTRLIDATVQAIQDLQETPTKYGDHAFLMYVITDGQENESSSRSKSLLPSLIASLDSHWTFGAFVPSRMHVGPMARYGFPTDNVQVWSVERGVSIVGENVRSATHNYMQARSKGMRSTKSLFKLDTSNLTPAVVSRNLDKLRASEYVIVPVKQAGSEIRTFCEYNGPIGKRYEAGHAYYELTKPETIQANKSICVQDNRGIVFTGTETRALLGLPNKTVRVHPDKYSDYTIFVQSTSYNRKLVKGTQLLYLK